MTDIELCMKEVIRKILISSGEPFSTSDVVVDMIYDYIGANWHGMLKGLSTYSPELRDILIMCRDQPLRLTRIMKYFRTICNASLFKVNNFNVDDVDESLSSFVNETYSNKDNDTEIEVDKSLQNNCQPFNSLLPYGGDDDDDDVGSNWSRLNNLLVQLSIPSPSQPEDFWQSFNCRMNEIHCKLGEGRLLRLSRIDMKARCESVEEFLAFSRLRQSASFLSLTRSRNYYKLWYWLFYCLSSSTTSGGSSSAKTVSRRTTSKMRMRENVVKVNDNDTNFLSTSPSSPSTFSAFTNDSASREGLVLLAHLLTGDVLDVIDMVLFNRKKLKISLCSPLTPIEIKEVLRLFTSVLYPLK
ncbi:unnamed protein product [Heterobilharzia americana]|nr:unnamed protein product [Heterobilharzia americana]